MKATDRTTLRPTMGQRLIRRTGVRNRLFPVAKLDQWEASPRLPYAGLPPKRLLTKIAVERADLDGRPVYHVTPRLAGSNPRAGHVLYLHGGAYVLEFIPSLHWPAIAPLANTLRRTITVPIYPLAPEHSYREVFPFLLALYRRILDPRPPRRGLTSPVSGN